MSEKYDKSSIRSNSEFYYRDNQKLLPYDKKIPLTMGAEVIIEKRHNIPVNSMKRAVSLKQIFIDKPESAFAKALVEERKNSEYLFMKKEILEKKASLIENIVLEREREIKEKQLKEKYELERTLTIIIKDALNFTKKNNQAMSMLPDKLINSINNISEEKGKRKNNFMNNSNEMNISFKTCNSKNSVIKYESNAFLKALGLDLNSLSRENIKIDIDRAFEFIKKWKVSKKEDINKIIRYKVVKEIMNVEERRSVQKAAKLNKKLNLYLENKKTASPEIEKTADKYKSKSLLEFKSPIKIVSTINEKKEEKRGSTTILNKEVKNEKKPVVEDKKSKKTEKLEVDKKSEKVNEIGNEKKTDKGNEKKVEKVDEIDNEKKTYKGNEKKVEKIDEKGNDKKGKKSEKKEEKSNKPESEDSGNKKIISKDLKQSKSHSSLKKDKKEENKEEKNENTGKLEAEGGKKENVKKEEKKVTIKVEENNDESINIDLENNQEELEKKDSEKKEDDENSSNSNENSQNKENNNENNNEKLKTNSDIGAKAVLSNPIKTEFTSTTKKTGESGKRDKIRDKLVLNSYKNAEKICRMISTNERLKHNTHLIKHFNTIKYNKKFDRVKSKLLSTQQIFLSPNFDPIIRVNIEETMTGDRSKSKI